jgi:hypothetical protein
MSAEAYSVAIRLSLTNMVSSGLGLIAKDLLGLEKNAAKVEDRLKALKMIGVGWGASHVGEGMLSFLGKTVEASKDYTHQVAQLNILGMKQAEIAEVISAAWKTSGQVITSSAADNIEAYRELRAVFGAGHEHEALAVLPIAQRSAAILASLTGKSASVKDIGYDISKAAELTTIGGMNEAQLAKRAEEFTRAQIAFGGKINAHDFHGALKMTRGASMNYNDDFISHYLPTLIQEMKTGNAGGQSAGVLLRNFDRAVVGQVIPLNKLQTWMDAGLVNSAKVVWNKQHTGLKKIDPGGVVGQDVASANPRDWWELYGETAVQKLMKTRGLTDIQAIAALGTNQMTTDLFKKFHFQKVQFDRDKLLIDQVGSSKDSYDKLLKTDPQLAQQAMEKQWSNVQARIGYEILPRLIPYMIKFADGLDAISQWMEKNPGKMQWIVGGFLGLGIAFSVLGKVMMTAGIIKLLGIGPMLMGALAPVGLVIGAIVLIGVLAYEVWKHWDVIKPALLKTWAWIADTTLKLWDSTKLAFGSAKVWLTNTAGMLWDGLKFGMKAFVGFYLSAWQGLFNTLISGINAILPAAAQIGKMHFADDFKGEGGGRSLVAPVPKKDFSRDPLIVQMHLDKKKVGEILIGQMAREASRPNTGTNAFDPSRSMLMPGTPSAVLPRN